jgi:hypothetical protein
MVYPNYSRRPCRIASVFFMPDGEILKGDMPKNKMKLISAWVEIHKEDLMANWKLAVEGQQPHKIEPPR